MNLVLVWSLKAKRYGLKSASGKRCLRRSFSGSDNRTFAFNSCTFSKQSMPFFPREPRLDVCLPSHIYRQMYGK